MSSSRRAAAKLPTPLDLGVEERAAIAHDPRVPRCVEKGITVVKVEAAERSKEQIDSPVTVLFRALGHRSAAFFILENGCVDEAVDLATAEVAERPLCRISVRRIWRTSS